MGLPAEGATDESAPAGPSAALVAVLAYAVFVLTLLATPAGLGVSPDSTNYLSAGLNWAQRGEFATWSGEPVTIFPPGLPLLLAAADTVGIDGYGGLRVLNAAVFAAIVVLGAALIRQHVSCRALAIGAVMALALAVPLLSVAVMAWTEPLFIVVVLLFLLALQRAVAQPRQLGWLVAIVVLAWAGFLLRYAGVTLIAVMAVVLMGYVWWRPELARLEQGLAALALSCVVPGLWMARNVGTDGTALGPRYPSNDSLSEAVVGVMHTLGTWAVPEALPRAVLVLVGCGVLAMVAAGVVLTVRRADVRGASTGVSLAPMAVFIVVYLGYLVASQVTTAIDPINSRLLSPIFVPTVVLVAVALQRVRSAVPRDARRAGSLVLVALISWQGATVAAVAWDPNGLDRGFATVAWRDSPLGAAAAQLPSEAVVYSNQPDAIWALTGRQPVQISPLARGLTSTDEVVDIPAAFLADVACGNAWLVWFNGSRNYLRTPDQLSMVVELEPFSTFAMGTVFRLHPLDASTCPVC